MTNLKGIKLKINNSVIILFAVCVAGCALLPLTLVDAINVLSVLLFTYFFVLVHEYSHAITARLTGHQCNKICLTAGGGYAEIDSFGERNRITSIMVALAGPSINLILAGLFWLVALLLGDLSFIQVQDQHVNLLAPVIVINLLLGLTNIIPIYPLDGARALENLFSVVGLTDRKALLATCAVSVTVAVTIVATSLLLIPETNIISMSLWLLCSYGLASTYLIYRSRDA